MHLHVIRSQIEWAVLSGDILLQEHAEEPGRCRPRLGVCTSCTPIRSRVIRNFGKTATNSGRLGCATLAETEIEGIGDSEIERLETVSRARYGMFVLPLGEAVTC